MLMYICYSNKIHHVLLKKYLIMFLVKLPGPHKLMRSLCGTLYAPCLVSTQSVTDGLILELVNW